MLTPTTLAGHGVRIAGLMFSQFICRSEAKNTIIQKIDVLQERKSYQENVLFFVIRYKSKTILLSNRNSR